MNGEQITDLIMVLKAMRKGEAAECRGKGIDETWVLLDADNDINTEIFEYRIAPKPLECWMWIHEDGRKDPFYYSDKADCEHGRGSGRAVLMREVTE